jgi:hypothetical protein
LISDELCKLICDLLLFRVNVANTDGILMDIAALVSPLAYSFLLVDNISRTGTQRLDSHDHIAPGRDRGTV